MGPPAEAMVPEQELLRRAASPPPPALQNQHHHPASPLPRQQRKGAATRAWLVVPESGPPQTEELGKHSVMRRTGIPARDLRILDQALSYPSTVLGRERAIVVNLEYVKAIITATEVLVPNAKDPLVAQFVRKLELRVCGGVQHPPREPETCDTQLEATHRPSEKHVSWGGDGFADPFVLAPNYFAILGTGDGQPILDGTQAEGHKLLPFEFRALEVCLECACSCLEAETSTLEQEAYPALDALTSKISTLNLERVRQIKNRLVVLSGRVHKMRDELEHLLDDDMDMAEMHLTEKLAQRQLGEASSSDESYDDSGEVDVKRDISSKNKTRDSNGNLFSMPRTEDLEMLLEAYFVLADGTLNKISALREYVDDTEDYINILLDDKQNQLLQMGVVLSTATLILSAGIVFVGLMGMNIHIGLFDSAPRKFWETAIGCVASCIALFITAMAWGKRSGVLS